MGAIVWDVYDLADDTADQLVSCADKRFAPPAPAITRGRDTDPVETTQIAPTILKLLGLDPKELQAVQIEGTQTLF